MRIIIFCVTLCYLIALVQSAADDSHSSKKKGKRQLDYTLSQPYSASHSLEFGRRISNGPHYSPTQYYPGPPRPYRKDPSQALTDSNHLADPIDRGSNVDTIYIPHKPLIKVIEKPVYIKEPEPIIEIIIKESNVTLPPPPTEAPLLPQKKKKEEVQVFYVKYKKNPNGYGKDAVIYDKPVPAISPAIPEEPEPEEEWREQPAGYGGYSNEVTEAPKPSTTLRTIIKPDSEVYHSPGNNVKVTFGKEGFDYDKRSSKAEEYPGPIRTQDQFPRARQLTSFSDVYFKRPVNNYPPLSSNEYRTEIRPPQPYRPFSNFPPIPPSNQYNSRPPNREINTRPLPPFFLPPPKFAHQFSKPNPTSNQSSRSSFPNFSHTISHPPPPNFQSQLKSEVLPPNQRKPVPYTPFENLRPSSPSFAQPPVNPQHHHSFNSRPSPTQPTAIHHQTLPKLPHVGPNIQFRPETRFNSQPTAGLAPNNLQVNKPYSTIIDQSITSQNVPQIPQRQEQIQQHRPLHHQQIENVNDQKQFYEHLRGNENFIPPGGQLVQSLPKFEQHLIEDPATGQRTETFPKDSFRSYTSQPKVDKKDNNEPQQQFIQTSNFKQSTGDYNNQHFNSYEQASTIRVSSTQTTPRPTTTTKASEHSTTTTKDPKILEAQLPDEVPDDLRQHLLSSGILNNADISILDYDKVGDIPLSALPPDQLANFYNAGGAQQLATAGSETSPQVAALTSRKDEQMSSQESQVKEVALKPDVNSVEMKIVKYNADSDSGREIEKSYISETAKRVDPVALNDNTYNRYLPIKVNGTQFPIPDVPALKNKPISSVVVLAPIHYDFSANRENRRSGFEDDIEILQNEPLKKLLNNPTKENYNKFLDNEQSLSVSKQAVVLLVTSPDDSEGNDKEIYMYDITNKSLNKLSGELSSAFVDAAEANSGENESSANDSKNPEDGTPSDLKSSRSENDR
ncbi:hypothetical protein ABEB36_003048 [Hypothenemus hampei]|uniref:Uncharacterized protein n=1 Tax=Hypothenemus hampei TaxID=57062 RepID=A0ABD1F9P1_HYPHA